MGLAFTVGTTSDAFMQPYAAQVQHKIRNQFEYSVPESTSFGDEGYHSEELGWSGWQQLQERAVTVLGEEKIPHLLALEAWQGVYLPLPVNPIEITVEGNSTPLQCGSLPALVQELEQLAAIEKFPTDPDGLQSFWEKYAEDDDLIEEDMDIQTYIQLMLSAKIATSHKLPLWVVK
jgi:hypothetical protein